MSRILQFLGLTAFVLSLAACGNGDPERGKLSKKEYWRKLGYQEGVHKIGTD